MKNAGKLKSKFNWRLLILKIIFLWLRIQLLKIIPYLPRTYKQATNLQTECSNMYDSSNMLNVDKVSIYSSNGNTIYPSSELWGYALSWSQSGGKDYYNLAPEGLRLDGGTNDTYAKYAFSACAGIDHLVFNYKNKKKEEKCKEEYF